MKSFKESDPMFRMPKAVQQFVLVIDAFNRKVGRFAMYLVLAMIAILVYSSLSKTFFVPALWTLETAQFVMVAFYMLGGPYSMQLNSHVRMDLLYGSWSKRQKAWVDCFTVFLLLFYLAVLLYGSISSTSYALEYGERSYSAWQPYMAPIKIIMCFSILLMLLQALTTLIRDMAELMTPNNSVESPADEL